MEFLEAFRSELRSLKRTGEQLECLDGVTRTTTGNGSRVTLTAHDLSAEVADSVIAAQIKHHRERNLAFEWKVFSFDTPPDLIDRLVKAGLKIGPTEVLLGLDFSAQSDFLAALDPTTDVRLVVDEPSLADFRSVAEAAFAKDYSETTNELAEALRTGDEGHRAFIAYVNNRPASVGRLYTDPASNFAGLYGGGTHPYFRHLGAYRAVVAARLSDAKRKGIRFALVDALPSSEPILTRLGFEPMAKTWPAIFEPPFTHLA